MLTWVRHRQNLKADGLTPALYLVVPRKQNLPRPPELKNRYFRPDTKADSPAEADALVDVKVSVAMAVKASGKSPCAFAQGDPA